MNHIKPWKRVLRKLLRMSVRELSRHTYVTRKGHGSCAIGVLLPSTRVSPVSTSIHIRCLYDRDEIVAAEVDRSGLDIGDWVGIQWANDDVVRGKSKRHAAVVAFVRDRIRSLERAER